MRIFSYIGLFILFAIGLAFAILNAETVTLNLYVKEFHIALSLLLIITLVIGGLLGALIMSGSILRLKVKISKFKAKERADHWSRTSQEDPSRSTSVNNPKFNS